MNTDQIKALKERADKASKLAADHELASGITRLLDFPWQFQDEAMRLAKAGILARLEAEIAELLKEPRRESIGELAAAFLDPTPTMYQPAEREECKVCLNQADDDGCIEHGRGCYVVSEDGGGTSYGHGTSTYAPCAKPHVRGT